LAIRLTEPIFKIEDVAPEELEANQAVIVTEIPPAMGQ
jgi:hypothetical protein